MVILGVDGGGSNTRAAVVVAEPGFPWRVLGRAQTAGANYQTWGEEAAGEHLRGAIQAALAQAGLGVQDVAATCLGLAGFDRPEDRLVLERLLAPLGLGGKTVIENDAVAAWAGATALQPGIVVIAGTGSIAFGVDADGKRRRAGGWGPALGDEGSGYDLGRQACRAVLWAHDGRGPATRLTELVLAHWGLGQPTDLLGKVYRPAIAAKEMAGLAPLVLTAAAEGDPVAQALVAQGAKELAQAAHAVARGLAEPAGGWPVAGAGGLLTTPAYRAAFDTALYTVLPRVRPQVAQYPPLAGAVLLAARAAGYAPAALRSETLRALGGLADGERG